MQCPDCDHKNPPGVTKCEECGLDLYDGLLEQVETRQLDRFMANADIDSNIPASSEPVLLYLPNAQSPISIMRRPGLIVGRKDPESKQRIDVDLSPYEAQALGVSRRHARIDADKIPPVLTDLSSYNGTFVNGTQLLPDQPHKLESGDEVRFGRLVTTVYFKSD